MWSERDYLLRVNLHQIHGELDRYTVQASITGGGRELCVCGGGWLLWRKKLAPLWFLTFTPTKNKNFWDEICKRRSYCFAFITSMNAPLAFRKRFWATAAVIDGWVSATGGRSLAAHRTPEKRKKVWIHSTNYCVLAAPPPKKREVGLDSSRNFSTTEKCFISQKVFFAKSKKGKIYEIANTEITQYSSCDSLLFVIGSFRSDRWVPFTLSTTWLHSVALGY